MYHPMYHLGAPSRQSNRLIRLEKTPLVVVPWRGLEPPRLSPLVPETSASTNSATRARPAIHRGRLGPLSIGKRDSAQARHFRGQNGQRPLAHDRAVSAYDLAPSCGAGKIRIARPPLYIGHRVD
jgi:hypothetical protein